MLTNYNGQAITYDAIGNPTKSGNTTYSWDAGRRLMTLNKSGVSASFTYDINGYRTAKTVNGVTTTYYVDGGTITALKKGTDELIFIYDEKGMVNGFYHNGEPYVYVKNLQGDIIGIVDINYDMVVSYKYDAWGKLLSVTGELANTLGKLNPFRYRGYVYDDETGLYYLNSRYYDASVGRFLNADSIQFLGYDGSILSYNLFIYCKNNPVNMIDRTGERPEFILQAWTASMWWLPLVDGILPVGDVIFAVGVIVIGAVVVVSNIELALNTNIQVSSAVLSESKNEEKSERSSYPIARRNRYSSRKAAEEAARRAGKGKAPISHPKGYHGNKESHFHPNVRNPFRTTPHSHSMHDHYYYPR